MKQLANFFFLIKYALLGGCIGFVLLFFMSDSPLSFNWQQAQKVWHYYQKNIDSPQIAPSSPVNTFSYAEAIEKAGPSVVSIKAFHQGSARRATDGRQGDMLVDVSVGVGSGVIFNQDGYIVTNYHVIAGSFRVAIHFSNGQRKYAKVIGVDPQNDIAVLKVDIKTPGSAELADFSKVKTGDIVMAIGTPFGLFENSVSLGIVSAVNHGPLYPKIQTDASINYGNSGGALINAKGEVIGINRVKFSVEKNDEIGINFATPIDVVKEIFDEILKNGRVVRNWLGLRLNQLNHAGYKQVDPGVPYGTGLLVNSIEKDSPGELAGLKDNDYMVSFDGVKVENIVQFRKSFLTIPIGKEVEVEVLRDKKPLKFKLKLREKPAK